MRQHAFLIANGLCTSASTVGFACWAWGDAALGGSYQVTYTLLLALSGGAMCASGLMLATILVNFFRGHYWLDFGL